MGLVSVADVKQEIYGVMDPDNCAYLCDNSAAKEGFTCRSVIV